MTFRRAIIAALLASAAALLFHCANLAGGGGSEWEAKISGCAVYDGSGLPVAGARVVLCPERFLKDTSVAPDSYDAQALRETVTDEGGFFSINRLKPGIFHIEVNNKQSWSSLSKCEISEHDARLGIICTLKPVGRISGTLAFPAGYQGSAFVLVYGLDRVTRVAPNGTFTLSDIPEGAYTLRVLPSQKEYLSKDFGAVAVAPSDETDLGTLVVPLNGNAWSYHRQINLNTSITGANIVGHVINFPVLIRLNSKNFDFSQAQSTGADIRFTKSDNTFLPYEIERWDASNRHAEIWVRVDTIRGNDSTQSLMMYWGNGNAAAQSNGPAVFDTASGFQGVWHLAEPESAIAPDATANRYDGTPSDTASIPVQGAIGIAREFDGVSNGIQMKGTASGRLNFPENGYYTVSAWVYSDTLDDKWHLIVGKSNGQYYLKQQINSRNGNWEFVEYHDKSGWQITETPVTLKTWKYLTGIREGDKQYIYLDGQLVNSTIKPNYDTTSRNTSDDVTIGRYQSYVKYEDEGYCFFDGKIDEVRIASIVHSADWIKLCFMNQRKDDRLIMFK